MLVSVKAISFFSPFLDIGTESICNLFVKYIKRKLFYSPANPQTLITWEPCKWQCLIYLISFLLFSFHYLSLVSKEVRVLNFNCFFCFPKGPLIDNKFAAPTWLQTLIVRQAVFLQKGLPLDYFCDSDPQTRKPTLRLGTAQKASEVRYTLIIFSFSLINIKCCLSIIFVLLLLFQIYHFTVLLSLFHCTHLFREGS